MLLNELKQFERETSHQMVVAVFPKVPDDYVMEDFTRRVAEEWGVGGKDRDNGMVLFVFPESRKLRVEVGCGLEGAVPDALVNRIINEEIIPSFRVGDLGGGIVKGVDALMAAARDGQQNPPVWVTLPDPLIINGQKHYAVQYESHDAVNLHITSSTKLGGGWGEPRIIPIKDLPTDLQRNFRFFVKFRGFSCC